jgi:beta-aspartyl-peptidase (threonine type)
MSCNYLYRMKLYYLLAFILLGFTQYSRAQNTPGFVLVVHGGAGAMGGISAEHQAEYTAGLTKALKAGYRVLKDGGTAVEAVTAAIKILEDDPLFNAGKGAVFTYEGRNELDAGIMDGKTLKAGAVAGVTTVKNPITAAKAVMEQSPHVMLSGRGADDFAAAHGCVIVKPSYFYTAARWADLQRVKKAVDDEEHSKRSSSGALQPGNHDWKYGTVGAVALDAFGNLAAGTSTGGMTAKRWNRIGDSPIIGAGTYANNATCAISCTGWGEYFIRLGVAKSISDMMEYRGETIQEAAHTMIFEKLAALGGDGGLIALDKHGNFIMPFNTKGMFRGYVREDGVITTAIYAQ